MYLLYPPTGSISAEMLPTNENALIATLKLILNSIHLSVYKSIYNIYYI